MDGFAKVNEKKVCITDLPSNNMDPAMRDVHKVFDGKLEVLIGEQTASSIKQEVNPVMCWGCLVEDDLRDMYQTYYFNGKSEVYAELLSYCFSIHVNEGMGPYKPGQYFMCESCVQRLRDAANFRAQIEVTRSTFKSVLDQKPLAFGTLEITSLDNNGLDEGGGDSADDIVTEVEWLQMENDVDDDNDKPPAATLKRRGRARDGVARRTSRLRKKGDEAVQTKRSKNKIIAIEDEIKKETSEDQDDLPLVQYSVKKGKRRKGGSARDKAQQDDVKTERGGNTEETSPNRPARKTTATKKEKRCYKKYKEELPYKLEKTDLQCKICEETFPVHKGLQMHMPVHFPNHICEQCGRWFATRTQLKTHVVSHTTEREACPICPNRVFKATGGLKAHMRIHAGDKFHYKCTTCPERFRSYNERRRHLVAEHGEAERKYACKHCPKRFCLQSHLSVHVRSIHLQERSHRCPECDAAFFSRRGLKFHALKHTGEQNFECQVCHKKYGRKYTLTEHMKIHLGVKAYTCTVCGRSFTQKCTLKGHMAVHDREAKVKDENLTFSDT